MSSPAHFECETTGIETPVRHRLGGPVDVVGYTADGERVGVIVVHIDEDNVDVIDHSETAVRLVATPAVEDE